MANLKRTREDILESVLDTVHRKGLSKTGLNELFTVSGTSSGSFYNYFSSKNELGHALIDFEWSKLQANIIDPALAKSDQPIEQILEIINRLEAKQISQPECAGCLLGNFIVDLTEQDESFQEHLKDIFNRWQTIIAQVLEQGRNQLKPEVNPTLLAEELLMMMEGVMLMGRLRQDIDYIQRGFESVRHYLKLFLA
ncbi:TetR/AcrR family transcriptional regulator [Euhalothece natronophila Z-M001]|uniref:TetR/AcrR family transcriptional regulator n=1 Tax=Euhalothece natronophila Z-M001 TaxID=522448 RepID=A0A5B8NJM5_9CHRO|nr:TetR/AcrR family transcriptional regulator [Euhalothece natronophila]QDZ39513.1 TetR/AcrR family transcriptional regulator [Euhalothece natronophila Z-M001]